VQIALDELRAEMAGIERDRIREKIENEKYKMNDEQMNKAIKNLYQKLREANSELNFTKETLEASNSKVKQLQYEYNKFND